MALGIEHTLLQPFSRERQDADRFMRTLGRLEDRSDLAESNWHIYVSIPVGSVPTGTSWETVAEEIERWYSGNASKLPAESSDHAIQNLPFPLSVRIRKAYVAGPGRIFTMRQMPRETVEPVVRQALSAKLGKLLAASVDNRVLLLEQNHPARGYWEVGEAVESLQGEFPEISGIDFVWCANTVAWATEGFLDFHVVWPLNAAAEQDLRRLNTEA